MPSSPPGAAGRRRLEPRQEGEFLLRGDPLKRHFDVLSAAPKRHLIGEIDASEPAVLTAEQDEMVRIRIGERRNVTCVRAVSHPVPAAGETVRRLHYGFASARRR